MKKLVHKVRNKFRRDNERGSRRAVLEDLFYDFNRKRSQIYKMNFFRGIFFGLGSVLGGTVVVALLVWILSFFVDLPGIGKSIQEFQHSISRDKNDN